MKPVNTKSLFTFVCDQMEKLDNAEISVDAAKAQANLAKQANNLLKYELERVNTLMKMEDFKKDNPETNLSIREIESKSFDSTI
jgi:hypothetical protein